MNKYLSFIIINYSNSRNLLEPITTGDDLCSTCTEGYSGVDCNFVRVNLPLNSDILTCSISAMKTTNFQGFTFTVPISNTYYLISSEFFSISVSF